jgi:4-carboxymuconolactone decarboxylase
MRLRHLHPDELDADQRALYDVLTTGPRRQAPSGVRFDVGLVGENGRLQGPFNAFLHHPRLGTAVQEVSRLLRFEGVLTARAREIVILVVAASQRSDFEWAAHAAIAVSVGVDAAAVAAIARGEPVAFDDPPVRGRPPGAR